ncbi:hypothetical protein TI39_contig4366g00001 [Zymoseptoria brevis]|uniref:Uncharacterized protein n=1 Tax=Zymoseptoria brevis TaxID=1047168 RepID=A0A0F4G761_9PEZI|nr:hypothetical protein TI39_contig4366g00001 [Zymoseptoria brevis]
MLLSPSPSSNQQQRPKIYFSFLLVSFLSSFLRTSIFQLNLHPAVISKVLTINMQYSTILLSALSITSALAAPAIHRRQATADTSIRVGLSNQRIELGTGTTFDETALPNTKSGTGSSGPFDTVDLRLGADVVNKAEWSI